MQCVLSGRAPPPICVCSADEFTKLGQHFAARSIGWSPSWAWVDASEIDAGSPFGPPPTGYLRASPLSVSVPPGQDTSHAAAGASAEDSADPMDAGIADDECSAPMLRPAARLVLHIVYSTSYNVPVLLMQGYHGDGTLWTPDTLRTYLGDMGGLQAPLAPAMLSQIEHPALHTPSCCIDPCGTAALMGELFAAEGRRPRGVLSAVDEPSPVRGGLDYLSAWWSVVGPHVGLGLGAHQAAAQAAAAQAAVAADGKREPQDGRLERLEVADQRTWRPKGLSGAIQKSAREPPPSRRRLMSRAAAPTMQCVTAAVERLGIEAHASARVRRVQRPPAPQCDIRSSIASSSAMLIGSFSQPPDYEWIHFCDPPKHACLPSKLVCERLERL